VRYDIEFDALILYIFNFDSDEKNNSVYFENALMNPTDFAAMVSKQYDRYLLATRNWWRNAQTGKDEIIETPAQCFKHMRVEYNTTASGKPTKWEITLDNEV